MRTEAQEHFDRAEVLVENGEYVKAAAAFLRAYETLPHRSTLLNVATCYDKAQKIPEAVEYYYRFLDVGSESKDASKVMRRLGELEQLIGYIRVKCPVPGCRVEVDDVDRGEASLWAVVEPGTHLVRAFAPGVAFEKVEVIVKPTETSLVEMRPVEPGGSVGPEPAVETPSAELATSSEVVSKGTAKLSVPFWITAGATIVAGGVTAVVGAVAHKHYTAFQDSGNTDEEIMKKGQNAVTLLNVMIVVTSALGATAVGLGIYDLWFSEKTESAPPNRRISVVPGPGLGLGVAGEL